MLTPDQWQVVRDIGVGGLLFFALIGGFRGWYVWGAQYREMVADRNFWRDIALKSMGHVDKALGGKE